MRILGAHWLVHVAARAYPGYSSLKRLGVFLLPPDMVHVLCLIHHSYYLGFMNNPPDMVLYLIHHSYYLGFTNNLLVAFKFYHWVERGTVQVKCLGKEDSNKPRLVNLGTSTLNHEAPAFGLFSPALPCRPPA